MKTLLNAILKYYFVLLFVLLEIISLSLVITSDIEKKIVFFSSANSISGFINKQISSLSSYYSLRNDNLKLVAENLKLKNQLQKIRDSNNNQKTSFIDTTGSYHFEYIAARVINNTVSKNKNFITIDKGLKDGIEKDFAVISPRGVVGIVVAASKHYSLVVSLLNISFGISGKIKRNNYYGSIQWEGKNYRYATMFEIPNHLKISLGDTVVTSGFSAIFPEGVDIGIISKVDKNASNNFFNIEIELLTDFKNLSDVYVLNNKNRREQILLENTVSDEY
jgi:rod shape-determining protein MreC